MSERLAILATSVEKALEPAECALRLAEALEILEGAQ
jgi:hypothetical protein